MKKILITTGIYPPDIGGSATYAKTLAEELPKRGFEVRIITCGKKKEVVENGQTKIITIDREQNVLFRYIDYYAEVMRNLGWADMVYAQGPVSEGFATYLACKTLRKKYYLKVVSDVAWEQYSSGNNKEISIEEFQNKKLNLKIELRRWMEHKVARGAKIIITPSNYLKGLIKQWGVTEDKIQVIYNAVEILEIKEGKSTLKSELGLNGNVILSAGRLVTWKGFGLLIEIMPELLKGNANYKLIIVGDGPEKNNLKEQIEKLGLEKVVFLVDKMDKKDLWKLMKASDMFVLNSTYEGLSHVLIEAMLVGVPIIASSNGGNVELIENNYSGILINYNDRDKLILNIVKLWHNRMLANDLIINAQKKAQQSFNQAVMLDNLIKIINL
ncbi:MAG: glycosyltransferase family 4 protein [Candidatus Falkowbacteria bacterium]|nr:glycosyltransferase family 4 protein [Candidatus Falkowbacteria bacterium]